MNRPGLNSTETLFVNNLIKIAGSVKENDFKFANDPDSNPELKAALDEMFFVFKKIAMYRVWFSSRARVQLPKVYLNQIKNKRSLDWTIVKSIIVNQSLLTGEECLEFYNLVNSSAYSLDALLVTVTKINDDARLKVLKKILERSKSTPFHYDLEHIITWLSIEYRTETKKDIMSKMISIILAEIDDLSNDIILDIVINHQKFYKFIEAVKFYNLRSAKLYKKTEDVDILSDEVKDLFLF